jgi:hypothetical protein
MFLDLLDNICAESLLTIFSLSLELNEFLWALVKIFLIDLNNLHFGRQKGTSYPAVSLLIQLAHGTVKISFAEIKISLLLK